MSTGKIIVGAIAIGAGLWLISRSSAARAAAPISSRPTPGTTLDPQYSDFGPGISKLPGVGQVLSVIKPIADNVTTPLIHKLNQSIGGVNPYQATTRTNPDGSVTTFEQGGAIEITHHPDGTETHTVHYGVNPKVKAAGVAAWSAVKSGASGLKSIVTTPVHLVEGLF